MYVLCKYVWMNQCMYVHLYVCMYIYSYVVSKKMVIRYQMYVCMYVWMNESMYVCTYMMIESILIVCMYVYGYLRCCTHLPRVDSVVCMAAAKAIVGTWVSAALLTIPLLTMQQPTTPLAAPLLLLLLVLSTYTGSTQRRLTHLLTLASYAFAIVVEEQS